jgi:uncharacterized protein (DUF433 family)
MPVQLYPHVVADPNILAGRPIIEGTQILASTLVAAVADGKSLDEVAHEHGVTVDDVRAALEFAAQRAGEAASIASAQSSLRQRLAELCEQVIASGVPLLSSWEDLDAEVADRCGERMPDESQ